MLDMRTADSGDDLRPLWNLAFQPDEAFFTRDYAPEKALIYTDGEKPVSMLHMLPRVILSGKRELRAGYLMGIVTDPAYRKRGLAGNLINAALKTLEDEGCDCAFLIPASAALAVYYGKFGMTLRGHRPLTAGDSPYDRLAGRQDIPKLSALYNEAFPDRALRDTFEWETILLEYTVLLGADGYTVGDDRGLLERVPAGSDMPEDECAACIRPFTADAERFLARPYINLLYT